MGERLQRRLAGLARRVDATELEYVILPAQLLLGVLLAVTSGRTAPLWCCLGVYGACTLLLAWGRARKDPSAPDRDQGRP